jgi:predicted Zn-dependent peptidase
MPSLTSMTPAPMTSNSPMARVARLAIAALSAVGVLATGAQAQYPTAPPAPLPLQPAQFPPFVDSVLANGLRVIVVHSAKQPVLSLTLAMPAGGINDPMGKSGTASLAAALLTKGAGDRTAEQVAAAIEGVGGSLSSSAGADFLSIDAAVLTGDRELAFELLADAALRPAFPASELELLRTQTLSGLALEKSQPAAIAARAFAKALYGDHPYGRREDENSVRAITRADLVEFHQRHVKPSQAVLVIAGDLEAAEAIQLSERAFGGWTGRAASAPVARPAPQRARTEILLVHRPGSVQSNLVVGNTTWMPTDQRGFALSVANQILGGASDSRLFQVLRETKGWTYGAYSSVTRNRMLGSFSATAEVRNEVTDSALVELLAQMRRMGAESPPADEFERAKQTLVGRFPLQVETAAQVAGQVATARLLGLPVDYVQTYRQRLSGVTAQQVQSAARSGIRADAALVVVVGDATQVEPLLAAIAPVRMVDVEGREIAAADLAAPATGAQLDVARFATTSDSFAILFQGQALGSQVTTFSRTTAGWTATERTLLGPVGEQNSEVRMGPSAEMQAVTLSGRIQGQDVRLNVTFADGRATGSGVSPTPQGPKPVEFSGVEVPAGVIDENAVQALLPYLAWTRGARFDFGVFASGKGVLERRTLAVEAEEAITVPAGTFPAYRVSYTGGEAPGTYWIEVAAPHRVLKFGPAQLPLEFVRVR